MDDASQDPHVQSPSATAHQQRALIGVGQGRAHRGPALDRATGGHGERHDPLFRTLPEHSHGPPFVVDIADVDRTDLADPQTAAVEQLERGHIAHCDGIVGDPVQRVESLVEPITVGHTWQIGNHPWASQAQRGIGVEQSLAHRPVGEAPQTRDATGHGRRAHPALPCLCQPRTNQGGGHRLVAEEGQQILHITAVGRGRVS